jgi:hypothetical protein
VHSSAKCNASQADPPFPQIKTLLPAAKQSARAEVMEAMAAMLPSWPRKASKAERPSSSEARMQARICDSSIRDPGFICHPRRETGTLVFHSRHYPLPNAGPAMDWIRNPVKKGYK